MSAVRPGSSDSMPSQTDCAVTSLIWLVQHVSGVRTPGSNFHFSASGLFVSFYLPGLPSETVIRPQVLAMLSACMEYPLDSRYMDNQHLPRARHPDLIISASLSTPSKILHGSAAPSLHRQDKQAAVGHKFPIR